MDFVTLDFETEFGDDYTLSKMNTESYIRDSRFRAHGAGIKWSPGTRAVWYDEPELRWQLKQQDWSNTFLLCHHAQFDALILSHHYDVHPAKIGCTLSMARMMLGATKSVSLDNVRKHFNLPAKTTPYSLFKGKTWAQLTPDVRTQLAEGACDEVESIFKIFSYFMAQGFPLEELEVVDSVIKMFSEPVLRGDIPLLRKVWENEAIKKHERLAALNVSAAELSSADRFAELLREEGEEPETKTSPKGNQVYAFAKTDDYMRDYLLEHENDRIRALAEARLGEKSTLLQTRAETLGRMAERGPLPVYLRFSGAGTLRFSGGDGANWQNFKRGSDIRRSIRAPEGYLLAPIDLSQVECRVLAYLAGEEAQLEEFRRGEDPYIGIACEFYGRKITKSDAAERGTGKQAILSCGYGSSGKRFKATAKLGVYGPPVLLSDDEADRFVTLYRSTHPAICGRPHGYWAQGENALRAMYNWQSFDWGVVRVRCDVEKGTRRIYFPNGAFILYDTLEWHVPTDEDIAKNPAHPNPGWRVRTRYGWKAIYGSMIAQHMCEAVSRLIMTQAMLRIKTRLHPVNSTHDELLVLIKKDADAEQNLRFCIEEMTREPTWLPGIPLAADSSGLSDRYEK
jgi:hypothetical protein